MPWLGRIYKTEARPASSGCAEESPATERRDEPQRYPNRSNAATPEPESAETLEAVLLTIPDLSKALQSYSSDELQELFEAFDLEVRYDKGSNAADISIALIPELLADLATVEEAHNPQNSTGARGRSEKSVYSGGRI
ncbi:MAG: hypothetical protein H0X39_20665 [Actinobacteria bacterium]|nr:hypothetical protein [Actinomycetota bacterium]